MNDQLQELLKRVYEEGVAKANAEADSIITNARSQAEELITKAKSDADNIVKTAQKQADDIKKNTESDLGMAVNHSLSAVKQKITDLILSASLNQKLSQSFTDTEFLKKLILEALSAWKNSAGSGSITISQSLQPQLDEYYLKSLKDMFDQKLKVDFSPTMKNGFVISPQDGTYKLSFSDEDFANLFKTYLRPRTKELLFES